MRRDCVSSHFPVLLALSLDFTSWQTLAPTQTLLGTQIPCCQSGDLPSPDSLVLTSSTSTPLVGPLLCPAPFLQLSATGECWEVKVGEQIYLPSGELVGSRAHQEPGKRKGSAAAVEVPTPALCLSGLQCEKRMGRDKVELFSGLSLGPLGHSTLSHH